MAEGSTAKARAASVDRNMADELLPGLSPSVCFVDSSQDPQGSNQVAMALLSRFSLLFVMCACVGENGRVFNVWMMDLIVVGKRKSRNPWTRHV